MWQWLMQERVSCHLSARQFLGILWNFLAPLSANHGATAFDLACLETALVVFQNIRSIPRFCPDGKNHGHGSVPNAWLKTNAIQILGLQSMDVLSEGLRIKNFLGVVDIVPPPQPSYQTEHGQDSFCFVQVKTYIFVYSASHGPPSDYEI
jgi:hypothetical protein